MEKRARQKARVIYKREKNGERRGDGEKMRQEKKSRKVRESSSVALKLNSEFFV